MQREAAKRLIQDTLNRSFDKEKFAKFVKELLNHLEDAPFTYKGEYIFKDYRDSVKTLERIGKYEDSNGKKLDVLIVTLLRTPSLERARSKQRNFVAKYLRGSRGNEFKDGALVAFVSPDERDWRFSLVKMEYKFDTSKEGQPRVIEEFTPARRYSFLVGENEGSHTAQSRLLPILEDTDNNPTLLQIEEAFNIEKVTKEFFENYTVLFHGIKEALEILVKNDKAIKADFTEKGIDTIDFAKKLLGQIVFLYFLQKKGWFGVARNDAWGTGPRDFLRQLFNAKMSKYDNFFNDILEPMFYEALAVERQADYYSTFKCKIPFLNGGLFDPLNNYDWVHTDILIPDELFSNKNKTKQGDTGTGILDVFDRYNFTVKEDEPLEKEVAVDPEMLGKVFENLLEVKDRKSKGTYYTPREIVHFMCQESLISYLATELVDSVNQEDIETLIKHGETALENDALVTEQGEETGRYKYKLPKAIRECNELIDRKLADIKVCDPAVGSGAFLVGMMSEIVKTRSVLAKLKNPNEEPNVYDFKRDAIQDSLHGVDIDLGAVEIAKLRLWLSLIVDEDNYKHIKPLPNLDYKIMQGNSLLEEYEGIKLIDERFFEKHEERIEFQRRLKEQQSSFQREYFELHSNGNLTPAKKAELEKQLKIIDKQLKILDEPKTSGQDPFDIFGKTEAQSKAEELLELHEKFFYAHHKSEKDQLRRHIDQLTWDLVESTLRQEGKNDKLAEVKKFQKTNTNPFFLWKLNFADVFQQKSGFDVVIANPPYITIGLGKKQRFFTKQAVAALNRNYSDVIEYKGNTFALFIELAIRLAASHGAVTFIVPNTLLLNNTFSKVRRYMLDNSSIQVLLNIRDRVFENAEIGGNLVFLLSREKKPSDLVRTCTLEALDQFIDGLQFQSIGADDLGKGIGNKFYVNVGMSALFEKIQGSCRPLGEIVEFYQGIITGDNGKFLAKEKRSKKFEPILRGKDIHRYRYTFGGNYVLFDKDALWSNTNERFFRAAEKLVNRQTGSHLVAAYDDRQFLTLDSTHVQILKDTDYSLKYVLALFNSALMDFLYNQVVQEKGRAFAQVKTVALKQLPIKELSRDKQAQFTTLVDEILHLNKSDELVLDKKRMGKIQSLEEQIDRLVYTVYSLTVEDITAIEDYKMNVSSGSTIPQE